MRRIPLCSDLQALVPTPQVVWSDVSDQYVMSWGGRLFRQQTEFMKTLLHDMGMTDDAGVASILEDLRPPRRDFIRGSWSDLLSSGFHSHTLYHDWPGCGAWHPIRNDPLSKLFISESERCTDALQSLLAQTIRAHDSQPNVVYDDVDAMIVRLQWCDHTERHTYEKTVIKEALHAAVHGCLSNVTQMRRAAQRRDFERIHQLTKPAAHQQPKSGLINRRDLQRQNRYASKCW